MARFRGNGPPYPDQPLIGLADRGCACAEGLWELGVVWTMVDAGDMDSDWLRAIIGGLFGGGLVSAVLGVAKWKDERQSRRRAAIVDVYAAAEVFAHLHWVGSDWPDADRLDRERHDAVGTFSRARAALLLVVTDAELRAKTDALSDSVLRVFRLDLKGPPFDRQEVHDKVDPASDSLRTALSEFLKAGQALCSDSVWPS